MNQLTYPWPFTTSRICGVIGSLCTVLLVCRPVIRELSQILKSLCSVLFLPVKMGEMLCTQQRWKYIADHPEKTRRKLLSSYRISSVIVFHLWKYDSPGCWSFFRQKRQKPKYSIIPCSLQCSQNNLEQNDKCCRHQSSQVISSALTSC